MEITIRFESIEELKRLEPVCRALDEVFPKREIKTPAPENEAQLRKTPDPEKKPRKKRTDNIDDGKINALKRAGWSVPKIADEMGISIATVYKHLQ